MIRSGSAARHARTRKRHKQGAEELNLIPLIDIFSVLVIFLLMNFGDMSILNLYLPANATGPAAQEDKPTLKLEVALRKDRIDVSDRTTGKLFETIPDNAQGHDFAALSDELYRIKDEHPDVKDSTLLLEPDTSYDQIVEAMDTMRVYMREADGHVRRKELFPDISVGDAPPVELN